MKKSYILLVLCAFFLGSSGILTQISLEYTSIMMLISLRFIIASLVGAIVF